MVKTGANFKADQIGLTENDMAKISAVFSAFENIEQVWLYGSRAKGNFKTYSDIDIALQGNELDLNLQYQIDSALDDLFLPYIFDLSILSHISNPDLLAHIERVGLLLYQKCKSATSN